MTSTPDAPAPLTPTITGPNLPAIAIGLLGVVVGALTIAHVSIGLTVDWNRLGPALFTGFGVLLVLAGTIGVVRRRRT